MNKYAQTNDLSRLGQLGRSLLKRFIYSQMALRSGFMIAIGREQPLVRFTVENDPPSIYWVFRIKSAEVEGLAQKLNLPPQFLPSPIRCLQADDPAYLLILNVYRVSGLTNGTRAEWAICVRESHESTPRYLVVDVRSSNRSMDPVNVITKASFVTHERTGNKVHTQVGQGADSFTSTLTIPEHTPPSVAAPEWVSANDFIYWGNGVRDRTFYNAGLANPQQRRFGSENALIKDGTPLGSLVEPEPVHILMFENAIEFVVSPWENIDKAHFKVQEIGRR